MDFENILQQAVGDLDEELALKTLDEFVSTNPTNEEAQKIVSACQKGMDIVGDNFEKNIYYVGDLIFAGELLSNCLDVLKPYLANEIGSNRGTIVLGTVEGDIHDIGKNIFKGMAEAAGFKVIDLGIDQSSDNFVKAVKDNDAKIVGLSGVLTFSIESMRKIINALKENGIRENLKIAIGGNAVSAEACSYVGADFWSKNAAESVKVCGEWVS